MRVILDFQGFKDEKNKFIPKELASYDGLQFSHFIFKKPYSLNLLSPDLHEQAVWLMKNYHHLNWNDGFTPLHHFAEILDKVTKNARFVYVKGYEKAEYIRKYCTKPIVELDEQPSIHPSTPKCVFHFKSPTHCALSNVFQMYDIFFMNE